MTRKEDKADLLISEILDTLDRVTRKLIAFRSSAQLVQSDIREYRRRYREIFPEPDPVEPEEAEEEILEEEVADI